MNIPRFHIGPGQAIAGTVRLNAKESRHALSVLRLAAGDAVELFDGAGRVFSGVLLPSKDGLAEVMISQNSAAPAPAVIVTLAVSVIKPDRMDWLMEKACELGVSKVVPFISSRTVVKLSKERWKAKEARWRKIALESCKQCGQSRLPEVRSVSCYADVMASCADYDLVLIPTLAARGGSFFETLKTARFRRTLALIGPEGDFTPEEVSAAVSAGARPVTLGPLVMRSETAAIYVLSALNIFGREAIHG